MKIKTLFLLSTIFSINTIAQSFNFYFPLEVGNKWFYKQYSQSYPLGEPSYSKTIQQIWRVVESRPINLNNTTALIETSIRISEQNNTFSTTDTILVNQSNNIITVFPNKLFLWLNSFSFDILSGRSYQSNFFIKQNRSYIIGDFLYHVFTDSIGFSVYNGQAMKGFLETYVVGCILNGKKYGEILENYIVGIQDEVNVLPSVFSLSQNYPNPFNPSTTIDYHLSTACFVTLKVYDVLGREVATLVDEFKQAGTYNSKFLASQDASRSGSIINYKLSSGVYFYRLQAGSFSKTKKLVIMK
jgi:hypothetical protein